METALVSLMEDSAGLKIVVTPNIKNKQPYIHMRFDKGKSMEAIYFTIKKAASLRYDYGHPKVKIEIEGEVSSEMSVVSLTKLTVS